MATVLFQPIYGSSGDGPISSLLEIDGFKILLDCGWDEPFSISLIEPLKEIAPTVDAVVISAPDMAHMGALAYIVAQYGLVAPIYATNPACKFGESLLYDAYQSKRYQSDFGLFGLEDIDRALERIKQVKFRQRVYFHGKGEGIEMMAYCASRVVGAAVWKFIKAAETVLYAMDFGHTKDKSMLLNPCDLSDVKRPSVMITDGLSNAPIFEDQILASLSSSKGEFQSHGNLTSNTPSASLEKFFETVLRAASQNGDVLIPVDTCGRSLELIHQFEVFWAANQAYAQHKGALPAQSELKRFVSSPVFFLTNMSYSTIEFARAQLEWMNDTYSDQFCDTRSNIWNLQHVQLVHSLSEVLKASRPRIILASTHSMDYGFSFDLFVQLAPLKTTTVIFTSRGLEGSLAYLLQAKYIYKEKIPNADPTKIRRSESEAMEALNIENSGHSMETSDHEAMKTMKAISKATERNGVDGVVSERRLTTMEKFKIERDFLDDVDVLTLFDHDKRVPLEGEQLEAYRALKKVEREEWEAKKKAEREAEALRLQEEAKLNEEKSIDHGSRIFDLWRGYDLTAEAMQKVRARGQHPMFPYIEPRAAFDDYGELFRLPSVLQEEEAKRHAKPEAVDDEEAPPEEEQVPTTAIVQDISFPIRSNFFFIDFEGRCDLRTFQNTIVNEVKPLALAFTHTPPKFHKNLTTFFNRLGKPIHFPSNLSPVDVASHRNIRKITIEHSTYRDLQFFPLLDYQVAIVSGSILEKTVPVTSTENDDTTTESKITPAISEHSMQIDTDASAKTELQALEQQIAVLELDKTATSDKEPLFIGDLKLREFKDLLDKHPRDFKTVLSGAVLTINDVVTVQREGKADQSTLVVDGPLCETYFIVRSLLYSRLTNL
jgi:Cft2 family RNA processing exonuclease